MSLLTELKRRNVFRVAVAYLAGAWLLVEVTDTLFSIYGLPDTAARVVVTLLAIGFPITLVLSWVYELTPEGLKLEKDIDRSIPLPRTDTSRLDRAIIVLLVLALGYFAFDKFVLEPVRVRALVEETAQLAHSEALVESYGDQSIAVLPFVNMSDDAGNEYFSDGISEELLNSLGQVQGLRVTARTSSFSFKGKDIPVTEIARQLNVVYVLEGSVRKTGNRVRITAQLIEAHSDTHIWSDTFDRNLDDIFVVQDEIAREIRNVLKVKFALEDTAPPPTVIPAASVDAYDAYLRGRDAARRRDADSLAEAVRHFEHALRLDANFAPAHAQLAIATILQARVGARTLEDAQLVAIPHIERAFELESDLAEAYLAMAFLEAIQLKPEAIDSARRALARNPSLSDAQTILANTLNMLGRYGEAEEAYAQVIVKDPLNIVGLWNYAERLNFLGRNGEAHEIADRLVGVSPGWGYNVHAYTSALYEGKVAEGLKWALLQGRAQGEPSEVSATIFVWIGEYDEARRFDPDNVWLDMSEGRWDEAIDKSRRAMEMDPDHVGKIVTAALVLYGTGHIDEALPLLERALELGQEGRPIVFHLDQYVTMVLAEARRQSGDENGAQAAAAIVREDHAARVTAGQKHENLDIWGALSAAFDGKNDEAIEYLRSAVHGGLREKGVFEDSILDPLRGDPRFIAVQAELDEILAEEREKVLQLICFNNPVPDDWRPLPETCEGVAEKP